MKKLIALALILGCTGCSTFKLGAMMYCPYGQNCKSEVTVPTPEVNQAVK